MEQLVLILMLLVVIATGFQRMRDDPEQGQAQSLLHLHNQIFQDTSPPQSQLLWHPPSDEPCTTQNSAVALENNPPMRREQVIVRIRRQCRLTHCPGAELAGRCFTRAAVSDIQY
jgi:hypothetical protein